MKRRPDYSRDLEPLAAELEAVRIRSERTLKQEAERLFERLKAERGELGARAEMQRLAELTAAESAKRIDELKTAQREVELELKAGMTVYGRKRYLYHVFLTTKPSTTIVRLPGERLGHALSILLTRRAYQKTVAPVIADAQYEYLGAVSAGRDLHARWIRVRLYLIVWPGWVYGFFASLIRRIIGAGTGG